METKHTLKQKLVKGQNITLAVQSSNISAISYSPKSKVLTVLFKRGTIYKYNNVDVVTVYKFLECDSIGQCFRKNVMDKFTYTRFDNMGSKQYTVNI